MLRFNLPKSYAGRRVGLLGGSFDPAHEGHVRISEQALKRFDLDQVWWLVSPANPLKPQGPAPLDKRVAHAKRLIEHPRIVITDVDTQLDTKFTCDSLRGLRAIYSTTRFIWLMGADNLAQIHQWRDWQDIFQLMPVGVLARPGQGLAAKCAPAARRFASGRLTARSSRLLSHCSAPAWCFVDMPQSMASSSAIRNRGAWG